MANTIWSAIGETGISTGPGSAGGNTTNSLLEYTPGIEEFTNLGLLYTRAYLTGDGTGTKDSEGNPLPSVSAKKEQEKWVDSTPLVSSLSIYSPLRYVWLPCMSKMLPGIDDSPTWTLMTDSPKEFIGRTYTGKPEKLATLEFTCPAEMKLQQLLTRHAEYRSTWTLIQCYDDPNQDSLFYIVTPRCQVLGVGTSSGENNSGGELNVKFQPMGGMFAPVYLTQPRTTA